MLHEQSSSLFVFRVFVYLFNGLCELCMIPISLAMHLARSGRASVDASEGAPLYFVGSISPGFAALST